MARYRVGLETRAKILAATRTVLGEAGLEGATLKAICDAAGVATGSFYNLFDSKEEAVLAVVREAIRAVDPHPSGVGDDTVEELVDAYVRFILGEPDLARVYLRLAVGGGLASPDVGARVLRHHGNRVERFADALVRQERVPAGETGGDAAEELLATLNGLAFRWLLDPSFDFARHARRLVRAPV